MPSSKPETILVVDDEPQMVQLVRLILETEGYSVLCAGEGYKALELARGHPGAIELLLTDMVMPHMNGRELASRLKAERPAMRILSMSGYLPEALGICGPSSAFLQKPFTRQVLARRVREVLEAA